MENGNKGGDCGRIEMHMLWGEDQRYCTIETIEVGLC